MSFKPLCSECNCWHDPKDLDQCTINQLRQALKPFANMHRLGCDPDEMVAKRGTGCEATHIFSSDFENAYKAINKSFKIS